MKSKIYYSENINTKAIEKLFEKVVQMQEIEGKTAVKTHFGEKGQTRYVNPEHVKKIYELIKEKTNDCFLSDTNTLYRGMRTNATNHKKIALEHGFDFAPIVIADGEDGNEYNEVKINKKHFDKAHIAKGYEDVDTFVVVSHFKGHILHGFGGALKNLSMGCANRAGKLAMHSKISPYLKKGCTACGTCVKKCPADAIKIENETAVIENKKCIGCAECIAVCPKGVIKVPFDGASENEVIERSAEYAYAAVKDKKCVYFTFINNITRLCDCISDSEIIGKDAGVIAGTDPVAMDWAAYDLLKEKNDGVDVFRQAGNPDGTLIMKYAEELNMGTSGYEIERV
ncbi:MAG: DUF362 domain-containing protein [Candidatus Nanoarchaeia archaeon]